MSMYKLNAIFEASKQQYANETKPSKQWFRCLYHMVLILNAIVGSTCASVKSSSLAKVSSYLPFVKIANRNPWYDKML